MSATEILLFCIIWGLLLCGLFFPLRRCWRKKRRAARDQKP